MARPPGLEPGTCRLEGGCTIRLCYGRRGYAGASMAQTNVVIPRYRDLGSPYQASVFQSKFAAVA